VKLVAKAVSYVVVFIAGGLAGSLLFDMRVSLGASPSARTGASNEWVTERFAPVCDRLKARGCTCEPVLFTGRTCRAQLDDLLMRQLFDVDERD
jgi:hypothetical protein